jgi:hypothetical protein
VFFWRGPKEVCVICRNFGLDLLRHSDLYAGLLLASTIPSLAADNVLKLLTFVSKHQPELYKTYIRELVKGGADEKHLKVVEVVLQALAGVVRLDEKVVPGDKCVFFSFFAAECEY